RAPHTPPSFPTRRSSDLTPNLFPCGSCPTTYLFPWWKPPTSPDTLVTTRWINGNGSYSPNGTRWTLSYTNVRRPCASNSSALLYGRRLPWGAVSDAFTGDFHSMAPARNGCPKRIASVEAIFANCES